MRLYITPGSPYARRARILVLEKGLERRVEVVPAKTRSAGSPYYRINPSPHFRWRERHARLSAWYDEIAARPAFAATRPPEA